MKLRHFTGVIIIFLFFASTAVQAQTTLTIRVNANSPCTSGCDGSTWAKAYTDLAPLLLTNRNDNSHKYIYWVAAGVYKPTNTNNRQLSFYIGPNTEMYGGFAGNENSINDRQYNNQTFLSGDIGTPQTYSGYTPTSPFIPVADSNMTDPGLLDNSYNVVSLQNTQSGGIMNHVTITGGCAFGFQSSPAYTDSLIDDVQDPTYNGTSFSNTWMGGGIFARGAINYNITDCIIACNYARGYGGGVYTDSARLHFGNCNIQNNYAGGGGGGVFEINSNTSLANCVVENNISMKNGGGYMTITYPQKEGQVDPNIANFSVAEKTQKLANAVFMTLYRKLNKSGGGVADPPYQNVLLALNIVANGLNAIAGQTHDQRFQNFSATFVNGMNEWGSEEALATKLAIVIAAALEPDPARQERLGRIRVRQALYGSNYSTVFATSHFYNNYAKLEGGAFSCTHSNFIFDGVQFDHNSAGYAAGAIYNESFNSPILKNCLFHHNTAVGAFSTMLNSLSTGMQVLSCTFSQNSCPGNEGYAVGNLEGSDVKIANSIFWGNTSTRYPGGGADIFTPTKSDLASEIQALVGNHFSDYTGITNFFSCVIQQLPDITPGVRDVIPGCAPWVDPLCTEQEYGAIDLSAGNMIRSGNISNDPLLDGNYRPTAHSPAIDAGNGYYQHYSNLPIILTQDFDGNARIQGSKIDIGCFEYGGAASVLPTSDIIYVNQAAAPGGDGTSWLKAFNDFQYALYAIHNAASGTYKQVWVAKGTYYPTTTGDRTKTFRLPLETIGYYGGFSGTETALSQRIVSSNPTVLSGNIGNSTDSTDNSYHVLTADIETGSLILDTIDGFTVSNGTANGIGDNGNGGGIIIPNTDFYIKFNNCLFTNNSAENYGGAISSEANYGISNCRFINNRTRSYGGAIYNASTSRSFQPYGCTFLDNYSAVGGAVYHNGTSVTLDHCIFSNNGAMSVGAGMYSSLSSYGVMSVKECLFANNNLQGNNGDRGAGMYAIGDGVLNIDQSTFTQNTIIGNNASGAALYVSMTYQGTITGSIVWNNKINGATDYLPYGKTQVDGLEHTQLQATCLQGYELDPTFNLTFYQGSDVLVEDPYFLNPTTNDFHLSTCSRAINIGNFYSHDTLDLDNNPRVHGSRIDMGAYEQQGNPITPNTITTSANTNSNCAGGTFLLSASASGGFIGDSVRWQVNINDGTGYHNVYNGGIYNGTTTASLSISTAPLSVDRNRYRLILYGSCVSVSNEQQIYVYGPIIYVDSSNIFSGNGSSWSQAFRYLADAENEAMTRTCAQLWVAKGTYYPSTNNNANDRIYLKSNVSLYGGFAGNETALSQRNITTNLTIVSGDIGVTGNAADNSPRIFYALESFHSADSTAVLDGFTIRDGNGSTGAAISIEGGSTPTIRNCNFISNFSTGDGGAMNIDGGAVSLENCTFSLNSGNNGGALRSNAAIRMNNCRFTGNYGNGSGGAVYLTDGNCRISNTNFTNNTSGLNGGAIRILVNDYHKSIFMTNCTLTGNVAAVDGGGISLLQSIATDTLKFKNIEFNANTGRNGGGMHADYPSYQSYMYYYGCKFKGNVAREKGGGLFAAHDASLFDCTVTGNKAYQQGGGLFFVGSNNAGGELVNSTLAGNYARGDFGLNQTRYNCGGGMYDASSSGVRMFNDIFYYNITGSTLPYYTGIKAQSYGNVITFINGASGDSTLYVDASGPMDVQGTSANAINSSTFAAEPQFVQIPEPFIDSTGGDVHLRICSPVVNVGDAGALATYFYNATSELAVDLDGNPRIYNNGIIDLGAYEAQAIVPAPSPGITTHVTPLAYCEKNVNQFSMQGIGTGLQFQWYQLLTSGNLLKLNNDTHFTGTNTNVLNLANLDPTYNNNKYVVEMTCSDGCSFKDTGVVTVYPNRLYVSRNVLGGFQDGRSWATAYNQIYDAFHDTSVQCNTQIWVSQGRYQVSADRFSYWDSSLHMRSGLEVYGGFVGNETSLDQRDYNTNQTIITGAAQFTSNQNNRSLINNNGSHPVDQTAILDGFFLMDARNGSALVNRAHCSPTIRNCTFQSNTTQYTGGAVFNNGSIKLYNCNFYNNTTANFDQFGATAAGMYNYTDSTESPVVINCRFKGNASFHTSALYSIGPINIIGCEITGNRDSSNAAVTLIGKANVINTLIAGNYAGKYGTALDILDADPIVTNCIIYGNNSQNYGRSFGAQIQGRFAMQSSNVEFMPVINDGYNNMSVDPLFVSQGPIMVQGESPNMSGDYHLKACSPMINNGDNSLVSSAAIDIDSTPRINQGIVDLGPYEYKLTADPTIALATDTAYATGGCEDQITGIKINAKVVGAGAIYVWQRYDYYLPGWINLNDGPQYIGTQTDSLIILHTPSTVLEPLLFRTSISTANCSVYHTQPISLDIHPKSHPYFQSLDNVNCINRGPYAFLVGVDYGAAYNVGTVSGDGVNNFYFDPAAAGQGSHIISYIDTSAFGCIDSISMPVFVVPAPIPQITPAGTTHFCVGDSLTLSVTQSFASYQWNDSYHTTTQDLTVNFSNQWVVTVTDGNGCKGSDSAVSVVDIIYGALDVSPHSADGCPVDGVDITCNFSGNLEWTYDDGQGNVTILPETTQTIKALNSGYYTVKYTTPGGCYQISPRATISIFPAPVSSIIVHDSLELCGGSVTLEAQTNAPGIYWSTGSNAQFITVTTPGTIELMTDNYQCRSHNYVTVVDHSFNPDVFAIDVNTCSTGNLIARLWSIQSTIDSTTNYTYEWYKDNALLTTGTPQIRPNENGIYKLYTKNPQGCFGTSQNIRVSIDTMMDVVGPISDTLCQGEQITLSSGGYYDNTWTHNGGVVYTNTPHYGPADTGWYYIDDYNWRTGCHLQLSKHVTFRSMSITAIGDLCTSGSEILTANFEDTPTSFVWSTGDSTTNITVTQNGTYYITATYASGCQVLDSFTIANGASPVVSISASQTDVCTGTQITFTATAINPGNIPTYQWTVNGIAAGTNNAILRDTFNDGDRIKCILTNTETCNPVNTDTSNEIVMIVHHRDDPSISITVAQNPVCPSTNDLFTATYAEGGSAPVFEWLVNGNLIGTTPQLLTSSFGDGDVITCTIRNPDACAVRHYAITSNAITMQVGSYTPSINITSVETPTCTGVNEMFTAHYTNEGLNPQFDWQINGISHNITGDSFTDSLLHNGDVVTCVLHNTDQCASPSYVTSDSITINFTTTSIVPHVTIATAIDTICTADTITFTATPINGGTAPTYEWYKNGTLVPSTTSSTFTSGNWNNRDYVSCRMTSNLACASPGRVGSNVIDLVVNRSFTPTISIQTFDTIICQNTTTFTANANAGFAVKHYQWRLNGVNSGNDNSSFTPATIHNGDVITCLLYINPMPCASADSALSQSITMTVIPIGAPTAAITTATNTIASGTSVTFTATGTTTGTYPVYEWFVNGRSVLYNSNTYQTSALNDGDQVTCELTSSSACASVATVTSNTITMHVTVAAVIPTILIRTTDTVVCFNTTVVFQSTVTGQGNNPTYQWKINGNPVVGNFPYLVSTTLVDGDVVSCEMTSDDSNASPTTATSNSLHMTVRTVNPSATVTADVNIACSGQLVHFTAVSIDGGTSPAYNWYVNSVSTGVTADTFSMNYHSGDLIYCDITSSDACAQYVGNSNFIALGVVNPPSITIASSQSHICDGARGVYLPTITNGGSGIQYQWYLNNVLSGTNSFFNGFVHNGDQLRCEITNNSATCNHAVSNIVTIATTPSVLATVNISSNTTSNCSGDTIKFTSAVTNPGTYPYYEWHVNGVYVDADTFPTFNNDTLRTGDIVTLYFYPDTTCPSSPQGYTSNGITITGSGVVNLGNDTAICASNSLILDAHNAGATYLWSDNTTAQTLTVTQPGTYSVTVNAGTPCSATSSINVSVASAPAVSLGNDTAICAGASIILNARNAGASYRWSDNSTSQTLGVSQAGTYSVTINPGSSCTASASIHIGINALPIVRLGNDTAICTGNSLTLDAHNVGSNYHWSDNTSAQTLVVSQNNTYAVTVTNANNCSAADSILVTINALPIVALGNDTAICSGNNVTLNAQNAGATYLWNDNSTSKTLVVSQSNNYFVRVTDANGCSASDTITVSVNTQPTVSLGNDTAICAGSSLTLDAHNTGATYLWSDNSTSQTLTVTQAGTYSVIANPGSSCSATSSIHVGINPLPIVNLGNDTTITAGNSVTLDARNIGSTFLWSDNSTLQGLTVTQAGNYAVTVTNGNGCSASDNIHITVASPIIVNLGNDTAICTGNSLILDAQNTGATYQWSDNSTSQTLTVTQAGNYAVTVTNGNVQSTGSIIVSINALPIVNIGNDTTICAGNSVTLDAHNIGSTYHWSDNSSAQTLVANQNGTYAVTVTNGNNCSAADNTIVTINSQATVNLGNDTTICSGTSLILNAQNAGAIFHWSDNSVSQTLNVNQPGTYTVTVTSSGNCQSNGSIHVAVSAPPVVNLGNDTAICSGHIVTLDAGNNGSTYHWSNNSTSRTLAVTQNGMYAVTVTNTNNCSTSDNIQVTVNSLPVVNLGNDTAICNGNGVMLDAQNTGSSYHWSDNSTSQTLTTNQTNTYSVTVTDGNNCSASDNIHITANALPNVNLGNDTSVCSGSIVTIDAQHAGAIYQWSNNSITQTISVTVPATYYVTVTDGNGCRGTGSRKVITNALPVVNLGNDTAICTGSMLTLDGGNTGTIYHWNDNSSGRTLAITQAGTYSVTVTNGNGCISTDIINVALNVLPVVSLGNDTAICSGNSVTLNAHNVGSTYHWSNNTTGQTLSATQNGTYSVTVSNASSCSASDNVVVTVNALPVVTLGNTTAICSGSSLILDAHNAGATYHWNDNTTAQTLVVSQAGIYSVTVTDGNTCQGSGSIQISTNALPVIALGNDTAVCFGNGVTLNAGNIGATYHWNDNSTAQTLAVFQSGTYGITVTNGNNCSASGSIHITVNVVPVIYLGNDTAICSGNNVVLDARNTGATYHWSDNTMQQTLTATQTGTYAVTVTNSNGCAASDNILVTVNSLPTVSLGNDTAICGGNSLTLNAHNVGAAYHWNDNSAGQTLNVTQAGTYSVTVTNASNCNASANINVTLNALPIVNLGNDTAVCSGNNVLLNANNTGSSFHWTDNTTGQTLSVMQTGTYSVTVTDAHSCSASDDLHVIVNALPIINLGNDTAICDGNNVTLDARNVSSNYQWTDNSTDQTLIVNQTGTYGVTVIDANSCSNNGGIHISVNALPIVSLGNDTTICSGNSVILDAHNIGSTYHWSDNSTNQTLNAIQTGTYTVTVTNSSNCNAAGSIHVTVTPSATPTVSIAASPSGRVCAGTNVLFTPTISGGGISPTYQWYVNNQLASTASTLSTSSLHDGDVVDVILTSSATCVTPATATSNHIAAGIDSAVTATVTITASPNGAVCAGTQVSFTANGVNGGIPTYQWLVNGIFTNTGSTYTTTGLQNGGDVKVVMTTNGTCAINPTDTSSSFTAVVNTPITPSIQLLGDTLITTAGLTYHWYLDSVLISNANSNALVITHNGQYEVEITDANGCSATSRVLDVTLTGIATISTDNWIVYPNPTSGLLNIQLSSLTNGQQLVIRLYDAAGKQLLNNNIAQPEKDMNLQININQFANGVYMLQVVNGSRVMNKRIVLNR